MEVETLNAMINELLRRVSKEKDRGLRTLFEVEEWISKAEDIESKATRLLDESISKCHDLSVYDDDIESNANSLFKTVYKTLKEVKDLRSEGVFKELVERAPLFHVRKMLPLQPIVSREMLVEKVWKCLAEDECRTLGIYGKAGVGKTTLLTQIKKKFIEDGDVSSLVIFVVVESEEEVESIQDEIGKMLGLYMRRKDKKEKAFEILEILNVKRFVLLLDGIQRKLDLEEIGVPLPNRENGCRIVFTTRSQEACGSKWVDAVEEVKCLSPEEAWDIFKEIVGETTLNSHPDIPQLARIVARKCGGFPIALSLIGETMSRKRTAWEWHHAIHVLVSSSAAEFTGIEAELLPILKFTYDNLPGENIRSCFLYCALFPKDEDISNKDLVDCWIGEGIIEEEDREMAEIQGYEIISDLVRMRLLMDNESGYGVKMHGMVREMALWISSDFGRQKENFVVVSGQRLHQMPEVNDWRIVRRMSVTSTQIEKISYSPDCSKLTTLFLQGNSNLKWISGDFFMWMTSLVILNLSSNREFSELPEEVSSLVSLQFLNLSFTSIKRLPLGLKELKRLIHLDLDYTTLLQEIDVIGSLLNLKVLRLFQSVPVDLSLMEDIQLLKSLEELSLTVREADVLKRLLSIHQLTRCIRRLHLTGIKMTNGGILLLNSLLSLRELNIGMCDISEISISWRSTIQREMLHFGNIEKIPLLQNIHIVTLSRCTGVRDLTWLLFAPNLGNLRIHDCQQIERIINKEKATADMSEQPFQNLTRLSLDSLPQLESIYWTPLPFPVLEYLYIRGCPKLTRLPFNSKADKTSIQQIENIVTSETSESGKRTTANSITDFDDRDFQKMVEDQKMDGLASTANSTTRELFQSTTRATMEHTQTDDHKMIDTPGTIMTGELVSFGILKLWDLLSHEHEQFQRVKDQVTELKRVLCLLSSFLKDAYVKKHLSALVREYLEEIKEIIFDAEDIIETFILKNEDGKNGGINKLIRRLAFIRESWEAALEIGSLSKRISLVIHEMIIFGVQQTIVDIKGSPFPEERLNFAKEYESDVVGMERNVTKLVGYLVNVDGFLVVSITGMGGLGKTTLARQAFNHKMVKKKFDRHVWVHVSYSCNRKNVWQTILQNFRPKAKENEILQMTEDRLEKELFRLLETSNSLIVFDDIWTEEDWNLIMPIFLHQKGLKVLLTSRNDNVPGRGERYINFKPERLSDQDSWTLFQRIAMPSKDPSEPKNVDKEMEEMGKKMIKHCGGLPLAVKVLGGLLAAKYTMQDWKRVYDNIGSHLLGKMRLCSDYHVFSLSFEELPSNLKHCFLYLAHFPEDYEINVEDLYYFWAAEGMIRHNDGETIRDVGDRYIKELVRRNMVISERDNTSLRFETCHLHDVMREICLSKAKEENFLQIIDISTPTAHSQSISTRRYVAQHPTTLDVEREINNSKARSLIVVWNILWSNHWTPSSLRFTELQLLRILHLPGAEFKGGKLPSDIGGLIHLRYLNLEDARVFLLPSSLRNLKLLIYLNLNVNVKSIFVPNVLMEMRKLRFLALPEGMSKKTKLELSNLVNLETLKNFSTENCSLEDLRCMARLRTLGILLTGESSLETLSASIGELRHMEYINIDYNGAERMKEWRTKFDFINIKQLELRTRWRLLSDELRFPSRLTSLSLLESRLEEDPMPILEKLGHLKEVELRWNSFCGRRMVCSGGGFPQLQTLELCGLEELEEWVVEEGSMPLLHTLSIGKCKKLKELPHGLRFVTYLMELIFNGMREEWEERLSEGGEDYYKVQHIPSVQFYANYDE